MVATIFIYFLFFELGVFQGIITELFTGFDSHSGAVKWTEILIKTNGKGDYQQKFSNASFLIKKSAILHLFLATGMISILVIAIFLVIGTALYQGIIIYALAAITIYFNRLNLSFYELSSFSSAIPKVALAKLFRGCSKTQFIEYIDTLAESEDAYVRKAACLGYSMLTPNLAMEKLAKMQTDENQHNANFATNLFELAKADSEHPEKGDLSKMDYLTNLHTQHKGSSIQVLLGNKNAINKLEEIKSNIDRILYLNYEFDTSKQQYYCLDCKAFSESKTYDEWTWIWCRRCHKTKHLVSNKTCVIGHIGQEAHEKDDENTIQISLWNAQSKKAISADLDKLHIIGGQEIDYDWAICASLEKLQNDGAIMRNFQIVIDKNVEISNNTQMLLNAFSNTWKEGISLTKIPRNAKSNNNFNSQA